MADDVEQILEEAGRRFEAAEVFEQAGEARSVEFEDNRLKRISARQFRGVGLRVIHEGRIGFASTTDLRDPGRLVQMAGESAQFGEKAVFELPAQPASLPQVPTEDPEVAQVTAQQMVEMGREGLEMSLAAKDGYLFSASIGTKLSTDRLMSTRGLDIRSAGTEMAASVEVQEVSPEGGLLSAYEFKVWRQPCGSITDVTEGALTKMCQAATVAPVQAEAMPVIFSPKAVDNLLHPVLIALSGKHVHKGSSRLAGQLGKRVLDERLTITDDPTIAFAPGSSPADDEGLVSRPRALIEGGVVSGFLLDLQTAGLLGMEPGANGHRTYASLPAPSLSNVVLAPGDGAYTAMVQDMERGVIVDQTLGSGQSNVLAGEFSVNVQLGFLVEGGRVRGRVKDCMVAGNVYELLSRVEGISRERQWVGADLVPAICVSGIRLAAKQ